MATLSSTTQMTRTILKWLGILISTTLVLMIIFRIASFIKSQITPPPPPNAAFGKLPPITFPANSSKESLSFSINTLTGSLPVLPDRAFAYKTIENKPQLLALSNASDKLSAIGFRDNPISISPNVYQWSATDQDSNLPKKISLDIFSGNFNLSSPFLSDSNVLSSNNLPNQTAAINAASSFLSSLESFPSDIDTNKNSAFLMAIKNGRLEATSSLSSTQVIRVSFFQKDLNGIPIVYPNPDSSTMNIYVSGGPSTPQIVRADYFHQEIASSSATYPIISANDAFTKLKNGNAYIINDSGKDNISISKVFLAYYVSDQNQAYVMPIVVFLGEGFTGYVSAVKDAWIQK